MTSRGVLIAAMSLDLGGAETHVIDLATNLADLGFGVHVASQGGRLVKRLRQAGIPHHDAPLHSRSPLKMYEAGRILNRITQAGRVDLFHAHGRIPAWVLTQVQRRFPDVPLVTTYHGVYSAAFPWNVFTRQGDVCIAVSDDIRSHLVKCLGFNAARVEVIPNGIDTGRFAPAPHPPLRDQIVAGGPGPVVTSVSRLDAGFSEAALAMVDALPALDSRHPGVVGVIVGDGDRLDDVRKACERCNSRLGRRAAIAEGGQEDVVPYLLSSDVVIAVARSALEAMACGKPVVLAGEGGFR
jgi:glycosyltransferase involved in cell wall biosynthesis